MADDPANDDNTTPEAVFSALEDPDCRTILTALSDPMTAKELATTLDIPQSTLYRKLDLLTEAELVYETITPGTEGGRISRYERNVTDVVVSVDDAISVSVERPARHADERLARMWSEMGEEL